MRTAAAVAFIILTVLTGVPAFAEQGFDYEAYLSANPDLPSNWSKADCMNHYRLYGFWENRAVSFNLSEYLSANPDLPTNWTLAEALNHYNIYGKFEHRLLAFSAQEYLSLYPDLPQDWSYDQAYAHYIYYGKNEGRIASFDETAYLELYEDLPGDWEQSVAFAHYQYYGQGEGRVYDPYDEDAFGNSGSDGDTSPGFDVSSDATYIYHEAASDYTWYGSDEVTISLSGSLITVGEGTGVEVEGSTVTITSGGTYRFSGTLNDGRIVVDSEDDAVVRLILDGVDISSATSAPIYIAEAEKTIIGLVRGSENYITDPAIYVYEDAEEDEPNAAIFSKDDLTIFGSGSLSVYANYNDGITSKDGLVLKNGTILVDNVADDGIRGKDYLAIKNGNLTVYAAGDGLKSDEDEDVDKGVIDIYGGVIDIVAEKDGLQAETNVFISDGEIDITSGGGSSVTLSDSSDSAKGIKGAVGVTIDGGTFNIDAADDAVHSNDSIVINGGTFTVATGDDGFHADTTLDIYDGDFTITDSYEGIESAVITIAGGNFFINADDDGLNCAGGNDGSGFWGGRDGGMPGADSGDYYMYIDGGYLAVYAQGDGLDSNGSIEMTGGTVLVHGPTGDGNGALDSGDFGGEILIDGGLLVAVGSDGMVESPDTASAQYSKTLRFTRKSAGTLFHIESSDGTNVVTFKPAKQYESIVISSPAFKKGITYNVYFGGTCSGIETDGLYEGGTYSGGTKNSSLSFSL